MTFRTSHVIGGVLATTLALGLPGAALAADSDSQSDQSMDTATQQDVSKADLQKFAAAYGQIQTVRAEYGRKLQQAGDDKQQRQKLKKEGRQQMVEAIRSEGLKVAEYKQIGQKLNSDEELRSRLQSMMKEKQQQGSGEAG